MGVPSENLNRCVLLDVADCVVHGVKRAAGDGRPDWIVSDQHVKVDRTSVMQSILKPRLVHHLSGRGDLADVGVAGKIEKHAKCHDTDSSFSLEVAVRVANVFPGGGAWVEDLNIARNVMVAVMSTKVVEVLISNICNIELMVANRKDIVIDLL